MSILDSDWKVYRSATVNDVSSNGGRMSATMEASGLANSIWPNASEAERAAGSTKYRKLYHKAANSGNLASYNTYFCLNNPTAADDRLVIWPGTQVDTQNDITGSEARYGAGKLNATVSASATSIAVLVESWASDPIFRDTVLIRISDKADPGASGNEEFIAIDGTPSASGDIITLNLATPLVNGYNSSNTYVASVIEAGTVWTTFSDKVVTSAAGTFDLTQVTGSNIGTVYQIWTLTFSSATAFSCSGDVLGVVGTGNISGTFAPTNTDFGVAYFSIPSGAFGGTFANGNTIVFTSTPAAYPIWEKRVIPAGASPFVTQYRRIDRFWESA